MKEVSLLVNLIDKKTITKIHQLEKTRYETVLHSPSSKIGVIERKYAVLEEIYSKFALSIGISKTQSKNCASLYENGTARINVYTNEDCITDVAYLIMVEVFNRSPQTEEDRMVQKRSTQSDNSVWLRIRQHRVSLICARGAKSKYRFQSIAFEVLSCSPRVSLRQYTTPQSDTMGGPKSLTIRESHIKCHDRAAVCAVEDYLCVLC